MFLLPGVTILLSLTVFLNMVAETMPATSDAVPLLGKPVWQAHSRLVCAWETEGVCFRVAHPVVGPLLSLLRLSHNICLEYSQFNKTEKNGFDYCIKYLWTWIRFLDYKSKKKKYLDVHGRSKIWRHVFKIHTTSCHLLSTVQPLWVFAGSALSLRYFATTVTMNTTVTVTTILLASCLLWFY